MPEATHATVTINSIHVIDSSVTTTAEPGSSAEWYMSFVVNGQTAQWSNDAVKDDTVYAVNRNFPNLPLGPNGMISIQVSGYEHDSTSANDTLPTLQKTLHPADDYELGGTDWIASPTSPEGSYSIEFSVFPAKERPGTAEQRLEAAREYLGVYRSGTGPYALWSGNWKGFTDKWEELSSSGLRLARLATLPVDTGVLKFGDSTERVFTGVFEAGSDAHALWVSEWPAFEVKWKELSAQGLRLVDLAPYIDGKTRMFAGVFRAGSDAHALWIAEWPSFQKKWEELTKAGLRLVSIGHVQEPRDARVHRCLPRGQRRSRSVGGANWKDFLDKRSQFARTSGLPVCFEPGPISAH